MPSTFRPWRVAVTRDEDRDGPLASALIAEGLTPCPCPVLVEAPPDDPGALVAAARDLEGYDWVVVASARAVAGLSRARGAKWPAYMRTAAAGEATARALVAAGVSVPPTVGEGDGAEALWATLAGLLPWTGVRVLVPTTPDGRTDLAAHLRAAGALVNTVDAYRMAPRPAAAILEDWTRAVPDAVVVASPRAAETLCHAIGSTAVGALSVVAIGATTAAALERLGVPCTRPSRAGFDEVARLVAAQQAMERSA